MTIKLYNTLTRSKDELKPLEEGKLGLYSCGPTVYDYAHIGNFRAYINVDILKRYLRYRGLQVKHVMNLTDVDDKIIKKSIKEKLPFKKITQKFTDAFFEDLDALRIDRADLYPKATDHIPEMIDIIQTLIEKGRAYKSEDGSVYFSIAHFPGYGKLSHTKLKNLKEGARVKQDEYEKGQAQDFALWKSWDEDDGDVFWETELGKGRPGWHIECSAMSMKHLGERFDIHAGGIDLVFPHHENEIAQSEGCTEKQFANYWFHNEHLQVEGKKMSKSLGNFFTLRDLMEKGHKPVAIRYFLLSNHYRLQLNLTEEALHGAQSSVDRINEFVLRLGDAKGDGNEQVAQEIEKVKGQFEKAMDDDLHISEALAHLFDFMREMNGFIDDGSMSADDASRIRALMDSFDSVLNVLEEPDGDLDASLQELIDRRELARKEKDWATADRLRDELKEKGIVLDDTKDGVRWKRVSP